MLPRTFLVFSVIVFVECERKKRLFSFDYQDRDISVDLDFSIPFIRIPIEKAVNSFGVSELPTININPASLALGGAVVMGTVVLLPLLMKNYATKPGYTRLSRLLENTDFSTESVVSFASQMLADGRGLRGCTLRVACWTAQEHYDAGQPKIMSHIVNNKLLSTIVNSTALEDAMLSGRYGRDCESYSPCPIQKRHMPMLLEKLAILTKYNGLFSTV